MSGWRGGWLPLRRRSRKRTSLRWRARPMPPAGAVPEILASTLWTVFCKIDDLLVELAEAGFDFFEIVGESLDLGGHGVEARAGIGLHVLDGLLQGTHGGVELADVVAGLLDQSLHDGVILGHLAGEILLALENVGDVALELDDFASDGVDRAGPHEAAGEETGEGGGAENGDITNTH